MRFGSSSSGNACGNGAALLVVAGLLAAGCASILDLEERELRADGVDGGNAVGGGAVAGAGGNGGTGGVGGASTGGVSGAPMGGTVVGSGGLPPQGGAPSSVCADSFADNPSTPCMSCLCSCEGTFVDGCTSDPIDCERLAACVRYSGCGDVQRCEATCGPFVSALPTEYVDEIAACIAGGSVCGSCDDPRILGCTTQNPDSACWNCMCTQCTDMIPECVDGSMECAAVVQCMSETGCRIYPECFQPNVCESEIMMAGVDASIVDQIGQCMSQQCTACGPAAGTGGTGTFGFECAETIGTDPCLDCMCEQCDPKIAERCVTDASAECATLLRCMALDGCRSFSECTAPTSACASVIMNSGVDVAFVDMMGGCVESPPCAGDCTDPMTWGDLRGACGTRYGAPDSCWPCVCSACDENVLIECTGAEDCAPVLDCMLQTGCRSGPECDLPTVCGPVISTTGVSMTIVNELGMCLESTCTQCAPSADPTCPAGRGDCDGNTANGCETDLDTHPDHCGTCNSPCASGDCVAGACQDGCPPGAGNPCGTNLGECQQGVLTCVGPDLVCTGAVGATTETCNGLDDDCDGSIDEDLVSTPCSTGQQGICAAGMTACAGGTIVCNPIETARAETCDRRDEDCDGVVDDGFNSVPCTVAGQSGRCADGANCGAGCQQVFFGQNELCNDLDDDCDGEIDEDNPGGGGSCGTNLGECSFGSFACVGGTLVCQGGIQPQPEVCNGLDDDCNGIVDDC